MTDTRSRRRFVLDAAAGTAAVAAIGAPAISKAQSDVIRIGHLTPRTGFLGPLGEYAVQAVDLAVDEINAAGGVLGRRQRAVGAGLLDDDRLLRRRLFTPLDLTVGGAGGSEGGEEQQRQGETAHARDVAHGPIRLPGTGVWCPVPPWGRCHTCCRRSGSA